MCIHASVYNTNRPALMESYLSLLVLTLVADCATKTSSHISLIHIINTLSHRVRFATVGMPRAPFHFSSKHWKISKQQKKRKKKKKPSWLSQTKWNRVVKINVLATATNWSPRMYIGLRTQTGQYHIAEVTSTFQSIHNPGYNVTRSNEKTGKPWPGLLILWSDCFCFFFFLLQCNRFVW